MEESLAFYAHSPGATGQWHQLVEHLRSVSKMARAFADAFGMGDIAYLLGLLHDLGKFNPEFQHYLRATHEGRATSSVPHAVWGAALLYGLARIRGGTDVWKELALPILGHHAGLEDAGVAATKLDAFWQERGPEVVEAQKRLAAAGLRLPVPRVPAFTTSTQREFAIRMVFSALVDADYLDTERHFEPEQASLRGRGPSLETLWHRLEAAQRKILDDSTVVNRIRREVYEACVRAASGPPGVYRLTVPTGGGKTRSGLAFALRHALIHDLRRVVVAIPYTSIIDQTARVYREILGDEAVLEHHSALQVPEEDERQDESVVRHRLATENWDAPIVVTTTVQMLESLFSNRPSKVRKIHRLSGAVIVLDEVQALPPELLRPTLDVLGWLATPVEEGGFGSTVVLSTATQPALEAVCGSEHPHLARAIEIVPDFPKHFALLKRVEYEWRPDAITWDTLAGEVEQLHQVLVVLNSRRDAFALLSALEDVPDVFHLSTLLCGAHRKRVLEEVKRRLRQGEPVRLVSTQVVEAGVDLDFPVVYRAVGPLDRIVQAAGRCNREGRLPSGPGRVIVFEPAGGRTPSGPYKVGLEKARLLLRHHPVSHLHDPDLYREYFRRLFADVDLDKKRIQEYRQALNYPEVAQRYRLIESDTVPVVVPYMDAAAQLEEFLARPGYVAWRRLQPYIVNLFAYEVATRGEWLERVADSLYLWKGAYDERLGMVEGYADPADLIV
ncbi:CRISPR-associated helicase/endonuclease Cas3 [Thermaerobacter subterraneus]|uniref:CRISPR-associated helicase, Cas3 family n=1 Tax=Thermaerobacter subterraneus DSM 13965 TaxID=867903 RepID=K6Q2U1_9FIRM|nr:CRISPR-associated helicase/endonuclease Cas3 [Thermaerobacter subterraneus]EKP95533.1 CRISPR-associated helicase, Cas3 family [Thermaerobacter subterraneus DSM 13965]